MQNIKCKNWIILKSSSTHHSARAKVYGLTYRSQRQTCHQEMHNEGAIGQSTQYAEDRQAGKLA